MRWIFSMFYTHEAERVVGYMRNESYNMSKQSWGGGVGGGGCIVNVVILQCGMCIVVGFPMTVTTLIHEPLNPSMLNILTATRYSLNRRVKARGRSTYWTLPLLELPECLAGLGFVSVTEYQWWSLHTFCQDGNTCFYSHLCNFMIIKNYCIPIQFSVSTPARFFYSGVH